MQARSRPVGVVMIWTTSLTRSSSTSNAVTFLGVTVWKQGEAGAS